MKFGIEGLDDNEEVNAAVHRELDRAFEEIRAYGSTDEARERCLMAAFDRLEPFFKARGVDVKSNKRGLKVMTKALRMELQKRIDAAPLSDKTLYSGVVKESEFKPTVHPVQHGLYTDDFAGLIKHDDSDERIDKLTRRLDEILEQMNSSKAQRRVLVGVLLKEFELDFDYEQLCQWARALARQWQAPAKADTPGNLETIAMNVAHFTCAISDKVPHSLIEETFGTAQDEPHDLIVRIWEMVADDVQEFDRCMHRCRDFYNMPVIDEMEAETSLFFEAWRSSSYAKLEISHKLAAAFCLTDIQSEEVMAPWKACSFIVPDGVLEISGEIFKPENPDVTWVESIRITRIWCLGNEPKFVILSDGTFHSIRSPYDGSWEEFAERNGKEQTNLFRGLGIAVWNLVRGCFLAMANPEEFKKSKTSASTGSKSKRNEDVPDFSQVRYMLSAPIQVDLREALKDHLGGRRKGGGGAPKVQFLVRGHWRQQAHGPGRGLRKTIWIRPFLKGDPTMRMLLRNYAIKDDEEGTDGKAT